jgi:hypothetical protein
LGKKVGLNFTSSGDRIKEIEDIDLGKTEIIQSPHKVLDLFLNMIKLAISHLRFTSKTNATD